MLKKITCLTALYLLFIINLTFIQSVFAKQKSIEEFAKFFEDIKSFSVTIEDAKKIGLQIWQNEASQRKDLLVFWNPNEEFLSLGIGHNIWFPKGHAVLYAQQFPLLCNFLQNHGVQLPEWLEIAKDIGAPWTSRDEFLQDTERIEELRNLLISTIDLQVYFMIERLDQQLPTIIEAADIEQREKIIRNIELMKSSLYGIYALTDYLNFKGGGLNPKEKSNGDGWGLLQVLLDMPDNLTKDNVTKAFTVSAANILLRLIKNSAPDYRRIRFLHGWMRRLSTYVDSNIFK